MAQVVFTAQKAGTATISFDGGSAIYRNSDNVDILNVKKDISFKVADSSIPVPSPLPVSSPGVDIGLKISVDSVSFNVLPGSTVKVFDLTSTKANGFTLFGYPTEYGPGINWLPSSGGIKVGETVGINIQVDSKMPVGSYKGRAVVKSLPGEQQLIIPVEVTVVASGDINGDGKITLGDMSALLSRWGKAGAEAGSADLNSSGTVDTLDFGRLIMILVRAGVIQSPADIVMCGGIENKQCPAGKVCKIEKGAPPDTEGVCGVPVE